MHEEMLNISVYRGNANKMPLRFHLTPARRYIVKNISNNKFWKE
jgi:hypothetical protein